jgi:gp16 family phage-associated protein
MSTPAKAPKARQPAKPQTSGSLLTAEEAKTRLHERGTTLKAWAEANGYPYATVSQVVRGINRGTYGMGHRIAIALGMKR